MSTVCTTLWIFADQVSPHNSALAQCDPATTRVLFVESLDRARLVTYHKRKLVLIFSVMRHFADDLRSRGFDVDYRKEQPDFATGFAAHFNEFSPERVVMMELSEYGATDAFRTIVAAHDIPFITTPLANYVSTPAEFNEVFADRARLTMETFYRKMREKTGLLMQGGGPVGGRWNFDAENRKPPKKGLYPPRPRRFEPDDITLGAIDVVNTHFKDHPGDTVDFTLPVSRADALLALDDFVENRLAFFGPYEDAMLRQEPIMYHSMLSAAINVGLLHPLECAQAAERAYEAGIAPLQSVEGFVRQLIGWREFMRGIYDRFMPEYRTRNSLAADLPLPKFYWTGDTDMACLRTVITSVLAEGYAHHIQRLMILGNFGLIAGIEPVALNDWFWAMFIDAYDWVMVPNVIGMTLHADGGIVGTKPYAASANYINSMSDYCSGCRYSPKLAVGDNACPFNSLYWDFLDRNRERFQKNPRMNLVMRSLAGRPEPDLTAIRARARSLRAQLAAGDRV